MPTTVVNIRTGAFYDVYIGRAARGKSQGSNGYFGNPYRLAPGVQRGTTLDRFRTYFYDRLSADGEFKARVMALKDKKLGCFCKPHACHGDIIAEYLDTV